MQLTLAQLFEGGLDEKVKLELEKIVDNIVDPNTEAAKARVLTISLKITPWDDRQKCNMSASVKSTLQPTKKIETIIKVGKNKLGCDAVELGKTDLFQRQIDHETGEIIDNPNLKNVTDFDKNNKNNKVNVVG